MWHELHEKEAQKRLQEMRIQEVCLERTFI